MTRFTGVGGVFQTGMAKAPLRKWSAIQDNLRPGTHSKRLPEYSNSSQSHKKFDSSV